MSSLFIALFFSSFQGGIAAGVVSLMAPATMRSQLVAIHFLLSNLLGLGLGPTVVAAITDYVFRSDVALGQSIALSACIMCPLAFIVLRSGTNEVERIIKIRMAEI